MTILEKSFGFKMSSVSLRVPEKVDAAFLVDNAVNPFLINKKIILNRQPLPSVMVQDAGNIKDCFRVEDNLVMNSLPLLIYQLI